MACAGGCSTVGEIVTRAANLLNDTNAGQPHIRWPRATLIDYLNEGMGRILARRPDAFAKTFTMTLTPGAVHALPSDYVSLSSIEQSISTAGEETAVNEVDHRFSKIFSKKPCLARDRRCTDKRTSGNPCDDYRVKSFNKHPIDEKVFTVEPPVPKGCSAEVRVVAIRNPPHFCDGDIDKCLSIDREYEAALTDWVMHRALSMDHESPAAATQAARHEASFDRMMAADYLTEQRYGSGYYRGEEGTKDAGFKNR